MCGLATFEDLVNVGGDAAPQLALIGTVRHQPPGAGEKIELVDGGNALRRRMLDDPFPVKGSECIRHHEKRIGSRSPSGGPKTHPPTKSQYLISRSAPTAVALEDYAPVTRGRFR